MQMLIDLNEVRVQTLLRQRPRLRHLRAKARRGYIYLCEALTLRTHLSDQEHKFARLRPLKGSPYWTLDYMRQSGRWENLGFDGTMDACLRFIEEDIYGVFFG